MIPRMPLMAVLLMFQLHLLAQPDTALRQVVPLAIGETVTIASEILQENRVLNIYLPEGYGKDTLRKYPLIYLLDGSMDEDFLHVVGLVQFGSFSWINMVPESIVVGISNVDRKRDFTFPTRNEQDKATFPTTGGSEKFRAFLEKELIPFVADHYRTAAQRTIIGQSLGGLLAAEILFKQPDLFDHYVIVSPSLWWDDESLLDLMPMKTRSRKSIYIAVGNEGKVMKRTAKALYKKVGDLADPAMSLHFRYFPNRDHADILHEAVYHAFETLFKAKKE
ncbi:MAG TPA: alpha/beta hydrolase-fold protein [Saprospiraceae bacterium]|nr:alpha/beta hydrolase-fold protein [Saprospiraceae bacterium]HMQ82718.1 alpha/beta hydrolase-fold protein [Saprospiraceae bacterium]